MAQSCPTVVRYDAEFALVGPSCALECGIRVTGASWVRRNGSYTRDAGAATALEDHDSTEFAMRGGSGNFTGLLSSDGSCECVVGWMTADCSLPCPGIDALSGGGSICGGHGDCVLLNGSPSCQCDPCFSVNPLDGTCEPQECPDCGENGVCSCSTISAGMECSCVGAFGGPACSECLCQNGGRCTTATGACVCAVGFSGTFCERNNVAASPAVPFVRVVVESSTDGNTGANEGRDGITDIRLAEHASVRIMVAFAVGLNVGARLEISTHGPLSIASVAVVSIGSDLIASGAVPVVAASRTTSSVVFGDVNTATSASASTNTITIDVDVVCVDVGNWTADIAVAALTMAGSSGAFVMPFDVVAPAIVTSVAADTSGVLDAGSVRAVSVTVSHASNSTAGGYDIGGSIVLDPLVLAFNRLELVSGPPGAAGVGLSTVSYVGDAETTLRWSLPGHVILPLGTFLSFRVVLNVIGTARPGYEFDVSAVSVASPGPGLDSTTAFESPPAVVGFMTRNPTLAFAVTSSDLSLSAREPSQVGVGEAVRLAGSVMLPAGVTDTVVFVEVPHELLVSSAYCRIGTALFAVSVPARVVNASVTPGSLVWALGKVARTALQGAPDGMKLLVEIVASIATTADVQAGSTVSPALHLFFDPVTTAGGTTVPPVLRGHTCASPHMYGEGCDVYCLAPISCRGFGFCDPSTGSCACDVGWSGAACEDNPLADESNAVRVGAQLRQRITFVIGAPEVSIVALSASDDVVPAGGMFDVVVVLSHTATSSADAFALTLRDSFTDAASLRYFVLAGSVTLSYGDGLTGGTLTQVVIGDGVATDDTVVVLPDVMGALGYGNITVQYTVVVSPGLPSLVSIPTGAYLSYSSQPNGAGRTWTMPSSTQAIVQRLGDRLAVDSSGLTRASQNTVVVGDIVHFTAVVTIPASSSAAGYVTTFTVPTSARPFVKLVAIRADVSSPSDVTPSCSTLSLGANTATANLCTVINSGSVPHTISIAADAVVTQAAATMPTSFALTVAHSFGDGVAALTSPQISLVAASIMSATLQFSSASSSVNTETSVWVTAIVALDSSAVVATYGISVNISFPVRDFVVSDVPSRYALNTSSSALLVVCPVVAVLQLQQQAVCRVQASLRLGLVAGRSSSATVSVSWTNVPPRIMYSLPQVSTASGSASITVLCDRSSTCSNHGVCATGGTCKCDVGFVGANCNSCDPTSSSACSGRGICGALGVCACDFANRDAFCGAAALQDVLISPPGGCFGSPIVATLSTRVKNAVILFTNASGLHSMPPHQLYSGPVAIASGYTTITAMVVGPINASAVTTRVFHVQEPLAPPVIVPSSGTYAPSVVWIVQVSIGAEARFTTDGSLPNRQSQLYEGPVTLSKVGSSIISVVAFDGDSDGDSCSAASKSGSTLGPQLPSAVSRVNFTVVPLASPPVIAPASGVYVGRVDVWCNASGGRGVVRYSVDGTTPVATSSAVAGPLRLLPGVTVVRCVTFIPGFGPSVASAGRFVVLTVASAPHMSPTPANYTTSVVVVLSAPDSGVNVFYTTDASPPTTSSRLYTSPIVLSTVGATLIRCLAVGAGYQSSTTVSGVYRVFQRARAPTFFPAGGTLSSTTGHVNVTIRSATPNATIRYTLDNSVPSLLSPVYTGPVVLSSGPPIIVRAIASALGLTDSFVALTNALVVLPRVAAPVVSPASGTVSASSSVVLSSPTTGATIQYRIGDGPWTTYVTALGVTAAGPNGFVVFAMAVAAGQTSSSVVSSAFAVPGRVVPVLITPPAATDAVGSLVVSMICVTAGARIYYTMDGSVPTPGVSSQYSGPLTLVPGVSQQIRAVATKSGLTTSVPMGATYTVVQLLPPPTIECPSIAVRYANVSLWTAFNVSIFYTVDCTMPSSASLLYVGPFAVSGVGPYCISAIAVSPGMASSSAASATVMLLSQVTAPTLLPVSGELMVGQAVVVASDTPGSACYYAVDGDPVISAATAVTSGVVNLPPGLSSLRVLCTHEGMAPSSVANGMFDVKPQAPPCRLTPCYAQVHNAAYLSVSTALAGGKLWVAIDGDAAVLWPSTGERVVVNTHGPHRVQCYATGEGVVPSDSSVCSFEILSQPPAPLVAPHGGTFVSGVAVELRSPDGLPANCVTRYTADASAIAPLLSRVYTSPLNITALGRTVVRAMTVCVSANATTTSAEAVAAFVVPVPVEAGCPAQHFGPQCKWCLAAESCSGNGMCDAASGACMCASGFVGQRCDRRAACAVPTGLFVVLGAAPHILQVRGVDAATRRTILRAAAQLSALPVTGTVRQEWDSLLLSSGSRSNVNVFCVTAGQLTRARSITLSVAANGSAFDEIAPVAVINVAPDAGTDNGVSIDNVQIVTAQGASVPLIWNFGSIRSITLGGGVVIPGTILAPNATLHMAAGAGRRATAAGTGTGARVDGRLVAWEVPDSAARLLRVQGGPFFGCGNGSAVTSLVSRGAATCVAGSAPVQGAFGEQLASIAPICAHGQWAPGGSVCACNSGWRGQFCDQPCSAYCNKRGVCSQSDDAMCTCFDPARWTGRTCDVSVCGVNGYIASTSRA